MAISTWGMSLSEAVSLTDRQVEGLLGAYLERKKFEAKITMSIAGEAMKPKEKPVSFAQLASMGFGIRGA